MKTSEPQPALDFLAIGAHPDDAELFAGGTLARLANAGRRVGILDLTRGESATRGTPETRAEEAREASRILGLAVRETLDLGDADLANTQERRRLLAEALRRLRPRVVATHWPDDRHPDHRRAHELVCDAVFFANVAGFAAAGERWKTEALVFFPGNPRHAEPRADWTVDVSGAFEAKLAALRAYGTQFGGEASGPRATYIASPEYWKQVERRAAAWGHRIGVAHAEVFILEQPAHASHPFVGMFAPAP